MEHPVGVFGIYLLRPRRVLRRGRIHDGHARGPLRHSVPVDAAGGGCDRGGTCAWHRPRRVSRAPRARRTVRAAHARGHVRACDDHPQHADRRRAGDLSERRADSEARAERVVDVLPAGAGTCVRDAADRLPRSPGALGEGTVRDPRRRGRGGSDGRADLPFQARRVRAVVRARRHRGRHPCAVRLVRDRRRDVLDHRSADRRADEHPRRHPSLGGPGDRRDSDHRADVRVHRRRLCDCRQGRRRRGADPRHPVHAAGPPRTVAARR